MGMSLVLSIVLVGLWGGMVALSRLVFGISRLQVKSKARAALVYPQLKCKTLTPSSIQVGTLWGETANGTEDIWWMPENDYPRLWWEAVTE